MKNFIEYINKQEQIDEGKIITLEMPINMFYDIYNILCDLREKKWDKLKNLEKTEKIDLISLSQDFYKASKNIN